MACSPERLVEGVVKVASLPVIYVKLEEAINDVFCSNQYIADIIGEDSALAARLLRLANSALYRFPSKIETISKATQIIGTRQLRDLILASCVVGIFKNVPEELVNMDSFWRHSIACALSAREISVHLRDMNAESYFVSGLLHDIGRLIMYKELPKEMNQAMRICKEKSSLLYLEELNVFGFDHAKLGSLLLREWKLPERLVEPVRYHHDPDKSSTYPIETSVLHLADIIAHSLMHGSSGDKLVPILSGYAWNKVSISESVLPRILDQVDRQFDSAVSFVLGEAA